MYENKQKLPLMKIVSELVNDDKYEISWEYDYPTLKIHMDNYEKLAKEYEER
jgi:hypothetical protein